MTKKLLLTFALLLTAVTGAWADDSGTCGASVTYTYVDDTQTLTISGTGDMEDYSSISEQPWSGYRMDIKTIVIESGVTSIGDYAFYYCSGLTSITIPASVTSIGDVAFSNCDVLTTVTFDGTSTLTTIGNSAFYGCTSLTSVTIPASVTTIDLGAFSNCDGLTTVTFDGTSTLTTIGEYAFQDCSNLTSITIPASVTTIGGEAFNGCTGLTSITIPASVESIAWGVFRNCTNLATMTVDAGNPKYDSRNSCNAIIETSTNTLIAGCKNTIIPDDVTTINFYAFEDCTGLTSIEIPASVTKIHDFAFAGCSNLATMTVDAGNPKYDSRNSCNAIIETSSNTLIAGCKNSTIPSSVTTILIHAFFNCTGLTSIEIPSSVTSIGERAFNGCSGLTSVTVYAPSCTLGNDAFGDCENLANIYVFSDKVESYQAADNWSDYASKITGITDLNGNCGTTDHESDVRWVLTGEDPYTLTIMKVGSTGDMKDYDDPDDQPWKDDRFSITKVVIGSGVTHIGDNAFEGVDAKFSAFVTKDNFFSYFDVDGILNVTFDELIFQGEFSGSDLPSYITLDRSITITGDNAVLNDIGFIIAADDVTLQNMKLVANSNLGNLIDIAGENATISNMYITYVVDEAANAINVYPGANGTQILNNKIYFESTVDGYAVDEVTNAICVNSGVSIFGDEDPIEDLVINGNEITAVIPAFLADIYENEYYVMGLSAVNGVRINGAEDFKFTNNTLNVTTNQLDGTTPTLQGMYVASSSGLIDKNTISMIDTFTPAGKDVYLYAVELVNDEDLTISNNTFNLSTTGGKEEAGAANAITAIASDFRITNNTITTESKGPNLGIYFPAYMGAPCDAAITGNIIKVTGLATSAHDTGLVSGIEIQTGDVEISGNTIYTYNIGEYAEGNYIYGISYAQGGINSNWTITDNTIYTEGNYAISLKSADDAVITENALCAHELFGDAAVSIASGSGNTVENNILGYAMPKTGERTYNIPANVSSFKVYDDGGKGRIYSPGCDGTLTLTAPEGYRLQLSGNITTEKDVDYLSVYDGSSNLADVLIDQVSSSVSGELTAIPTVTSTGQSITFYFHSDNSNKDNSEFDGLDLTVTLVYTITYNLNEGTNATGNPATYTVNTETFTLDDPSRDGYEFAGWFSDAEFNTPATTTIEQGSTGNKTFWAKWKKLMTNSDITIADIDDQEWTDSAIMPTVTVKDSETDITDQCDFEFTDNSDTGEATVTITAKSTSTDYAGSTLTTFNIVPKAVTSDGGTAITEDQDGMTAIIDESTQNGGVVPDNVTDATLTYTRTIPNSGDAWTVCLPYDPPTGDDVKYYTLESVSGTTLNFTEVTSPQAKTPYLVVATTDTGIGAADLPVDFGEAISDPEAVDGYQFKGTLRGLDHAASVDKYILQSNNKWGIVLAEKTNVYIPPFRAYIESTSAARSLDSNLNDGTTGIDTIRTVDADGTEQWFDLSGRRIDKPTKKGLYIHNGKKEIVK